MKERTERVKKRGGKEVSERGGFKEEMREVKIRARKGEVRKMREG